ncbi:cystathionine beta-lyase [Collibacillus ludicampi]|uniref:cysteine-S-conjugate beta-lyase n=1 Tax=Collibacillus ludicampi TaxID=2771369 RepID=A0AAV4LAT7_9BACL|nr:PatB family C-S lyase [Collibacillus ludicampi]GIM44829.1 cystathionine beta-lyase [Collibacillus ludicampi]
MKYNFDEVIDRIGTNSSKWDYREKIFGTEDVLPLWVADMDFPCPPCVVEAIIKRAQHPIYGYPGKPREFYAAAVHWLKRRFGVDVQPEWMATVPGVVPGIHIAIEAFTNPGDKVVVQPPVYHPFFRAIRNRGRQIVENPLMEKDGRYYMDFADLREKIDERTRMLILCSPHNPVGRVWERDELLELADICMKNDIIIISDEIHSDLVYEKGKHIPLFSLSPEISNHCITFISVSKTFNLAGLFTSIAFTENPKILRELKMAIHKASMEDINLFGIEALIAAYNEGEDWLEELLLYLKGNAEYISNFLRERIPQVKMQVPEGTYLGWMDFRELGLRGEELKEFIIRKAKLGLNDGMMFGAQGEGFQRINFACSRKTLEEAMLRLEKAVKELKA